jgi:hypothetical protein
MSHFSKCVSTATKAVFIAAAPLLAFWLAAYVFIPRANLAAMGAADFSADFSASPFTSSSAARNATLAMFSSEAKQSPRAYLSPLVFASSASYSSSSPSSSSIDGFCAIAFAASAYSSPAVSTASLLFFASGPVVLDSVLLLLECWLLGAIIMLTLLYAVCCRKT